MKSESKLEFGGRQRHFPQAHFVRCVRPLVYTRSIRPEDRKDGDGVYLFVARHSTTHERIGLVVWIFLMKGFDTKAYLERPLF
jgi:hypothetical protein